MGKHDAGGQSQRRFERGRREAIKHWFKDIIEMIKSERNGRDIYLGCSNVYINQFKKYMPKDMLKSIKMEKSVSVDDNCLWELVGISRRS